MADSEALVGLVDDRPVQNASVGHGDASALVAIDRGVEPTHLKVHRKDQH